MILVASGMDGLVMVVWLFEHDTLGRMKSSEVSSMNYGCMEIKLSMKGLETLKRLCFLAEHGGMRERQFSNPSQSLRCSALEMHQMRKETMARDTRLSAFASRVHPGAHSDA